jgi:hypothetical protein
LRGFLAKMKGLAHEQIRALETHYRAWREVASRGGPTDRKRAENAIGKLYTVSGHDWPSFVWYESPRELLISQANSLGRYGLVSIRDSFCETIRLQSGEKELKKSLRLMPGALGAVPFERFPDQQWGLIMETLPESLQRVMVESLGEISVGLELDGIAFHEFCDRHLGVKYESGRLDRLRRWSEIGKSCYWWAPYETTCFVSDGPTAIHLDASERIHNLRGPAMAFNDGWSLYSIHGCFVSERLVMQPEEVRPEDLPLDESLEVLHATIEMLGHERFLAAARARLIQQDVFGRLYQIPFHDYEPILLVEVTNATPEPDGSVRHHLLRVPPEVETAHEAVAWSFGRRTKAYAPAVQT